MIYLLCAILMAVGLFIGLKRPGRQIERIKRKTQIGLDTQDSSVIEQFKNYSDALPRISQMLGNRFTNLKMMGVGGMGMVLTGIDKTNHKVAIKTILPDLMNDPQTVKLFFTECEAIKKMNHPNIVKIIEVGQNNNFYYYVMEHLEGETLKKRLAKDPKLTLKEVISIGCHVSRALQHCHDNHVVHRDIKPSNVFLTDKHGAKIIDFGIVKELTGDSSILQGTTRIGSPDYAPPEQLQGEPISGKSDVYALGTVIYEMVAGKLPYKQTDLMTKMFDPPTPLKEVNPEFPEELSAMIDRCISIDPSLRPKIHEVWAVLRKFLR